MMQTEVATTTFTATAPSTRDEPVLTVRLASSSRDVEQAFRLRYQVFVEEPHIEPLYDPSGLEHDPLDDISDHLIVRDETRDIVVATYRMLPGARATRGLYTESEFELGAFRAELPRTLELARSCVHRDYRHGAAAKLLWDGMLRYWHADDLEYLTGCVSFRYVTPEDLSVLYSHFLRQPCGQNRFGIRPKPDLRIPGLRDLGAVDSERVRAVLPAMVKGYFGLGGEIVPEPIYDPIFRTYDFCMIAAKSNLPRAYQRKYGRR